MDSSNRCRHHGGKSTGPKTKEGKKKVAANAVKHGLHTSAETFFENADEHHLDTYYSVHESLCSQYENLHGHLPHSIKKDLAEIAFEMTKLDMAKEYEAENAVDSSKPLTEMEKNMSESGIWEKEVVSKVEQLKTNIRRENRLALKDMGIYKSPEQQIAEAQSDIGSLVAEKLQED